MAIVALVIAQALYTFSDAWKKLLFGAGAFDVQTLLTPGFIAAILVGAAGFLFQMYALSKMDLSRTIVTMGMLAVVFSTAVGVLYFHDRFSTANYAGVGLALAAIVLVNLK